MLAQRVVFAVCNQGAQNVFVLDRGDRHVVRKQLIRRADQALMRVADTVGVQKGISQSAGLAILLDSGGVERGNELHIADPSCCDDRTLISVARNVVP